MNDRILKTTALNQIHRQLGARMVDFAGWDMPVQYAGTIEEHMAVRTRAGIFDVSHMGEVEIRGPNARETVQRVSCNDANRLAISQCQYSALTTPDGTFVDDILIYCMDSDRFLLCVNASNQEKDYEWIRTNALPEVIAFLLVRIAIGCLLVGGLAIQLGCHASVYSYLAKPTVRQRT